MAVVPLIDHLVGHDQMVLGVDRDLYIVADGSGAFAASSHRGCLRRARQFGAGLRVTGTLTCEQSVLLGPVERQIELAQTRRGEFTGLPPLQDRLDQLRAQEGKANQTPDVAPGDVVTERSGTTGGELLKPRAPAGDRPDQRRITSRSVDLLRESGQHQLGFSTAPLEGDCRDDVLGILPDNTCDHVHEEAAKEDSNGNVYSSGASGSSPKTRLDSDQV